MTAWAAALLLLSGPSASALKPASQADRQSISALLKKAYGISLQIESDKDELRKLGSRLFKTRKDTASISAISARLATRQADHAAAVSSAVELTLRAYGLVPVVNGSLRMPRARSVVEGFRGPERVWNIRYGKELALGPIRSNTMDMRYPEPDRDERGRTFPDGTTVIWGYYEGDARLLALLLYHELRHFEQFTTLGQGDVWTSAQRDDDAYKAEWRAIGPTEMWKDKAFEKRMEEFMRGQLAKVSALREEEKRTNRKELTPYSGSDIPTLSEAPLAPVPAPEIEFRLRVPERADQYPSGLAPAGPAPASVPDRPPAPSSDSLYPEPREPRRSDRRGYYDPCIEEGRSCLKQ